MRTAIALLLIAAANPAFAQEIVVTGERRAQDTSTLAGNAAVLSGAELGFIGAQAPNEALNRLPGVGVHRNNGVENLPAIRSPVLVGNQSAGSFLVLEDGVPIRAPGFSNVNSLFETGLDFAERVEVVRGPGSALYGSNAVHGIVNVISPRPGLAGDEGNVQLDAAVGDFGRQSLALQYWRGALATDDAAVRRDDVRLHAGVAALHDAGWRADSDLAQQMATFGFATEVGDWGVEARLFALNVNQETASFVQGAGAYDVSAIARANPTPEAYRDARLARARITFERDDLGSDWTFRVTPYARWIEADLNLSFFPSRAQELTEQAGGGLQAGAYWDPSPAFSLILGADADWTSGSLYEFQFLVDQPNGYLQGLHYDYDVAMRVLAAYVQASWSFAQDWRLVAGLRGESVTYDYENHAPDGDFGRFRRPGDREDSFEAMMPKLGVVWSLSGDQSVWLNYARGARPPQITDLYSLQITQGVGEQGVETLDSIELGWRGLIGDARLEIALYHMDKRDTSFRNADGFTVTDGRTRHQGIEVSGVWPITAQFDLSGWVTYARHTYRFDDPSARAGESISSGDDVDTAPRWLWNARLRWTPIERIETELEWVHVGAYFTNASNTASYEGHDVLNWRSAWAVTDGLSVFAAIRNVTDTDYAERADFAFGNDRYFPGEDRALTIGLSARR